MHPSDNPHLAKVGAAPGAPRGPAMLLFALAFLLPLSVYFETAVSIASIWRRSDTFAHGYIILPIALWLVWKRRDYVLSKPLQPCWPVLALLAGAGLAWMLGELGDVLVVRQYAFAAMLPLSVWMLLGTRMARAMVFPLAFIMLGVPFGEVFVNPLINVTADFTVYALQAFGVPLLRQGNSFTIPTGSWSVVEACSGVRYLISSFTLGCLFAYLSYRSRLRQAIFIGLSIVVPIVANGMRAVMIVMMGHLSGMTMAVGVDHIIYGWVFFGLVMFVLFWIGSRWREDLEQPGAPGAVQSEPAPLASASTRQLALAGVALLAALLPWPAAVAALDQAAGGNSQASLMLNANWAPAKPFTQWRAGFTAPNAELNGFFGSNGDVVGATLLHYRHQRPGSLLITSANHLAPSGAIHWNEVPHGVREELIGGSSVQLRETAMVTETRTLLVWSWYVIGGRATTSDYLGKVLQVRERVTQGRDDGSVVILFAPYEESPEGARNALRRFLSDNKAAIDTALAGAARH